MIDLDLEQESDGRLVAKISSDGWEFNVRGFADEFAALGEIESADWVARRSIHAGTSAGSPVYWSCSGEVVSMLVGDDDETWDITVTLPLGLVHRLARDAAEFRH